jgi:hypothetical protein
MCYTFHFSLSNWDYFYAVKFPGNKSFRVVIIFPFCICSMFNFFSNFYKEIAEDIGHVYISFNFSSFTVRLTRVALTIILLSLSL